jgi:hypothetical protein
MSESLDDVIISQTKSWIKQVVIGLNFCPFAAQSFNDNYINYKILNSSNINLILEEFIRECNRMDTDEATDTSLLILPTGWKSFNTYLDLLDLAEKLIAKEGLEGIYQIASFHPDFLFAGTTENDASNYTNRSPYPMLHILREDQVEKAVKKHKDIHSIPHANISKANELGVNYFKNLNYTDN